MKQHLFLSFLFTLAFVIAMICQRPDQTNFWYKAMLFILGINAGAWWGTFFFMLGLVGAILKGDVDING